MLKTPCLYLYAGEVHQINTPEDLQEVFSRYGSHHAQDTALRFNKNRPWPGSSSITESSKELKEKKIRQKVMRTMEKTMNRSEMALIQYLNSLQEDNSGRTIHR